jgi:hypothetical protein
LNKRFAEKVPLPSEGKLIHINGFIYQTATNAFGDKPLKRLMVQVVNIAFLGVDAPASTGSLSSGPPLLFIPPLPSLTGVHAGKHLNFSWASPPNASADKGKRAPINNDDKPGSSGARPKHTRG